MARTDRAVELEEKDADVFVGEAGEEVGDVFGFVDAFCGRSEGWGGVGV